MTPDVVVDIGNSRMKWGWIDAAGACRMKSHDPDDAGGWEHGVPPGRTAPLTWAVATVHPARRDRFVEWVGRRGDRAVRIEDRAALPISIRIREPGSVGIDRLLGAIGANARRRPGHAAVTIDIGTAATVNVIDPTGAFRGGAILPGFRLMTQSLHQYTAKLPLVEPSAERQPFPGEDTTAVIQVGIRAAVTGGVYQLCNELCDRFGRPETIDVFVTGGGSTPHLLHHPGWTFQHVPTLNLEGIRLVAEAMS